jgi:hypothetical protein
LVLGVGQSGQCARSHFILVFFGLIPCAVPFTVVLLPFTGLLAVAVS